MDETSTSPELSIDSELARTGSELSMTPVSMGKGKHEPARRDAEPNPAKTPTEYESDRKHLTSREVEKLIEGDQLRHACGFALADHGIDRRLIQDCLGYRNIQHTVKYTASNPARFEPLWR